METMCSHACRLTLRLQRVGGQRPQVVRQALGRQLQGVAGQRPLYRAALQAQHPKPLLRHAACRLHVIMSTAQSGTPCNCTIAVRSCC
jgi:hypothetical protein